MDPKISPIWNTFKDATFTPKFPRNGAGPKMIEKLKIWKYSLCTPPIQYILWAPKAVSTHIHL